MASRRQTPLLRRAVGKKTADAVFFISKMELTPLKTIVYVDGFNFYYRKLKDSNKKWLNHGSLAAANRGVAEYELSE